MLDIGFRKAIRMVTLLKDNSNTCGRDHCQNTGIARSRIERRIASSIEWSAASFKSIRGVRMGSVSGRNDT